MAIGKDVLGAELAPLDSAQTEHGVSALGSQQVKVADPPGGYRRLRRRAEAHGLEDTADHRGIDQRRWLPCMRPIVSR